jgi:hypothetical protein
MKLVGCLLVLLLMIFSGCANMGVAVKGDTDPAMDVMAKIAGHRAGFELAKANVPAAQDFIKAGDALVKMVETGDLAGADAMIKEAIARLMAEVAVSTDDPALIAEITIMADMFTFTGTMDTAQFAAYLTQCKAFMEGFKMGVDLWDKVK